MTVKKSYKLALLSILFLMGAGHANAQSQMSQGVGKTPQFLPVSGWNIQPTALAKVRGLESLQLPCMMAVNYDNGYTLRFSGASKKMLAMAIDFRQEAFVQGRKYGASVSVDGQYSRALRGMAFSESVLIFNMREAAGFYAALSGATKMTLDVEDNPMLFSLNGIDTALTNLESCSVDGAASKTQMASISSMPTAPEPAGTPMVWGEEVTPVPARISKTIKKSESKKIPLWKASVGDDMKVTLERWANRAGVKLDWQATQGGVVSDDISVQGSFEDAVQTLMARNATALGLDANMKSSRGSMTRQVSTRPQQLVPSRMMGGRVSQPADIAGAYASNSGRWSAPMGSSLQQVLQSWSQKSGVELVWESSQGFSVRLPVSSNGSYEAALQSLLNQYTDERIRPNAQLNNDPITGRRTLFVQSSRVL